MGSSKGREYCGHIFIFTNGNFELKRIPRAGQGSDSYHHLAARKTGLRRAKSVTQIHSAGKSGKAEIEDRLGGCRSTNSPGSCLYRAGPSPGRHKVNMHMHTRRSAVQRPEVVET